MLTLKDKTAIITGGGSGIGRAISILFAANGANVHILELNTKLGNEVAAEIILSGGRATVHACDVTRQAAVISTFKSVGSIDVLVNNAGIAHIGRADNTSAQDFDHVYSVNVKGVYNCLYAAIPLMKKTGRGVILNMSSIAVSVGLADRFAYSMSKGAIHAMTLSVARDYVGDNIRCNSISPARVHTPFVDGFINSNYPGREKEIFEKLSKSQPIGRMGKPEEVAAMALFICSDQASFLTGCDYPVDGGFIKLNT
jgi:NAD(P)-dependent dehydrogenase (short-subunit alcohol dehydrogenase family)